MFLLSLLIQISVFSHASPEYFAEDFSILFPVVDGQTLIGIDDLGSNKEAIFPKEALHSVLPNIYFRRDSSRNLVRDSLKEEQLFFSGIRLVPGCGLARPSKCSPYLRAVVGAWHYGPDQKKVQIDIGYQLFYKMDLAKMESLVEGIAELRLQALPALPDSKTLGLHRLLVREGYNSQYAKNLKALILKNISVENLVSIATLKVGFVSGEWSFVEFQKNSEGKFVNVPLFGIAEEDQNLVPAFSAGLENQWLGQNFYRSTTHRKKGIFYGQTIFPFTGENLRTGQPNKPATRENLHHILVSKEEFSKEKSKGDFLSAEEIINKIENPKLHDQSSTDCLSCHITPTLRVYARDVLRIYDQNPNYKYASSVKVDPNWIYDFPFKEMKQLRLFGHNYFNPVIAPRVVNETDAAILSWIELKNGH